jgi:hypothetical protein
MPLVNLGNDQSIYMARLHEAISCVSGLVAESDLRGCNGNTLASLLWLFADEAERLHNAHYPND